MQVISRPEDIVAALSSSAFTVAPCRGRSAILNGCGRTWLGFPTGEDHARRRGLVVALLSEDGMEQAAAEETGALICEKVRPFDIMPMARDLTALVRPLGSGATESKGSPCG